MQTMTPDKAAATTPVIAIVGPTATGKTAFAVAVAKAAGGEIVSADSRQVYRGMDIGTGKDLCEYGSVPYHLIDIADAGEKYNLYRYLKDADAAICDIAARGCIPVICGGSGLYVESLIKGLRPPEVPQNPQLRENLAGKSLAELTEILSAMKQLHNNTDTDTPQRAIRAIEIEGYYRLHPEEARQAREGTPRKALVVGVSVDRDVRRTRISRRLDARLKEGMVAEVQHLLDSGIPAENLIYYGLEYKFITEYLQGIYSLDEMHRLLEIAIHQFAKRQMTWFRGSEQRGMHIEWLDGSLSPDIFAAKVMEMYHSRFPNS